jgi:hypothetical protein
LIEGEFVECVQLRALRFERLSSDRRVIKCSAHWTKSMLPKHRVSHAALRTGALANESLLVDSGQRLGVKRL